jgi:hypothetical protein
MSSGTTLPALLSELGAGRYVVYGVVTEIRVKYAAFGLLKTGARVDILTDAVEALDPKRQTGCSKSSVQPAVVSVLPNRYSAHTCNSITSTGGINILTLFRRAGLPKCFAIRRC